MSKAGRPHLHRRADRIFTIRLNEDIETEALALSVIDAWLDQDENHTPRQVVSEGLALLGGYVPPTPEPEIDLMGFIDSFQEEILQLRKAIKELRDSGISVNTKAADKVATGIQANLPGSYLKTLGSRVNKGQNE